MARRSSQGADELRQSILNTARSIIEQKGLQGLSAREIASRIEYSPGTLYNVFRNLDDVVLTLQLELISNMHAALKAVPKDQSPRAYLTRLTTTYVEFAICNRHMWNSLFAHTVSPNTLIPGEIHAGINNVIDVVANAVAPMMPGASKSETDEMVRAIWSGVHGITSIAVTEKAPYINSSNALHFVELLSTTVCDGLQHRKPK